MPSSSLPSISSVNFDTEGLSVWNLLLNAEKEALSSSNGSSQLSYYKDNVVAVRVLGFFLKDSWDYRHRHPFGLTPYKHLVQDLNSCTCVEEVVMGSEEERQNQNAKVFILGNDYRNHLMRLYRSNEGPLPPPSARASPPSWDKFKKNIVTDMGKAPTTKKDAKKQALYRDGYKCMISGIYDQSLCFKYPELLARAIAEGRVVGATQVTQLFFESAQDNKSLEYAGGAFEILKMFGIIDSDPNKPLGGQTDDLCNVLTMTMNLHHMFDNFSFWLEVDPHEPHTYDVCSNKPHFFDLTMDRPPRRVTFQVDPGVVAAWEVNPPKDEEDNIVPLPSLPDPGLVAIRAACARVAHLSGAAEQADRLLEDREDTKVMADNGKSERRPDDTYIANSIRIQLLSGREEYPLVRTHLGGDDLTSTAD